MKVETDVPASLTIMLLLSCLSPDPATGTEYLPRGEAAEMPLAVADDHNPGV